MCDFVSAERRKKGETETLESGIAVLQCWCFFFFRIARQYSCLFSFLEGTIEKDHFYKSVFWKTTWQSNRNYMLYCSLVQKKWNKHCAKIVPCLKRKLYFEQQSSTVWSSAFPSETFFGIVKLWFFIIRSSKQVKIHLTSNPPALHPTKSLHLCYLFILAIICQLPLISVISWEAI